MTNEELNTYQIFRNAVIINISKEKLTNIKGFEGTIVNNIDIALESLEILKETNIGENFRKVEIYQTYTKEEKEKQKKLFISRAIQYNEVCETKQETFETVVSGNKRAA